MLLKELEIENFRNYEAASVVFSPAVNVVAGENAQGKTNLLEAAYYLCGARSFRTRSDKELLRFGEETARLRAVFEAGEREQELELRLRRGGRKQIFLNGVKKTAASELSGTLCAVLFCPEDMELVRGGPAERRRLMDLAISQLRPRYAAALSRFSRAYEHKLRILRDWREKPSLLEVLDTFNTELARAGAELIWYRAAWCARLAELAAPLHGEVSGRGEKLELRYQTVKTVEEPEKRRPEEIYEALLEYQATHRRAELDAGLVLSGAMKDDLLIRINGSEAKSYASQGQARTAALSIKLSEREIIRQSLGEYPLLLLDDVLSELDERRQDFVINRISGGQVLISCCDARQVAARTGGKVFEVEDGKIKEE